MKKIENKFLNLTALLKSSPFIPLQRGNRPHSSFFVSNLNQLAHLGMVALGKKSKIFFIPPLEGELGGGCF